MYIMLQFMYVDHILYIYSISLCTGKLGYMHGRYGFVGVFFIFNILLIIQFVFMLLENLILYFIFIIIWYLSNIWEDIYGNVYLYLFYGEIYGYFIICIYMEWKILKLIIVLIFNN